MQQVYMIVFLLCVVFSGTASGMIVSGEAQAERGQYKAGLDGVALYSSLGFGAGGLIGHDGNRLEGPFGGSVNAGIRVRQWEFEFYGHVLFGKKVDSALLMSGSEIVDTVDICWNGVYAGLRVGRRFSLHREFTVTPSVGIGTMYAVRAMERRSNDASSSERVERYPFAPLLGCKLEYNTPWVWGPLAMLSRTFDGRVSLDVNTTFEHHSRPPWGKGMGVSVYLGFQWELVLKH